MSRENVELWMRGADAWTRGDKEDFLRDVPPDWEFHTSGLFPGLEPVYRGSEGAAKLWDAMQGPWESFDIVVERAEDLGDKVLGLVTFKVRGRDGLETSRRWAYIVSFRDGLPRRTDNFTSWDVALEAAGLSE